MAQVEQPIIKTTHCFIFVSSSILLQKELKNEVFNGNAWRLVMKPDRIDLDIILIPPELHGMPISESEISVRLHNVLISNHLRDFGDLHGLPFNQVGAYKNCGPKCLSKLRDLVRAMQNEREIGRQQSSRRSYFISIPAEAHKISPNDLPISARLASILRSMDIQTLGDLNGIATHNLLKIKNCGRKTLRELTNLLKRVENGDFQPPAESFSPPALAEAIRLLDKLLMEMTSRDRDVLLLRFDACAGNRPSLTAIASKFQVSPERIRQIIKKKLLILIKASGPKLIAYLQGIFDFCHKSACPFTLVLLTSWIEQYSIRRQFPLSFYVCLLEQLQHDIRLRGNSQEPCNH